MTTVFETKSMLNCTKNAMQCIKMQELLMQCIIFFLLVQFNIMVVCFKYMCHYFASMPYSLKCQQVKYY